MSHEQEPSLLEMVASRQSYRQRFWDLYTTLRRVERGEI
jgi:hypothetical protein